MTVIQLKKLPSVSVITTHGKLSIEPLSSQETIFELLSRSSIPWSAVSIFSFSDEKQGNRLSNLSAKFSEIDASVKDIQIHFNRNINPEMYNIKNHDISPADGTEVSNYLFQAINNEKGNTHNILKGLSQNECQSIICKNVHDFIRSYVSPGDVLVVGVSGGGDSNSLLLGLTSFTDFSFDVRPVILKGIPDWDAGVPRALELCKSYGLHLTVVEEEEVRQISKLKDSSNIIGQYESIFPGDDFEFLGTYMIRKVLMHIASSCNGRAVTGLNLEDVFAESLLMISNKRLPLPFPVRKIDGIDFIYPLWLCPKKIIDGCFPKFSMENYEMRYPCFSTGRNLYYMMTYTLQSMYPGALENLLRGFQNISQNNEHGFMSDPDFGSSLNGEIENNIREKFLKIMLP
ncbi:hypothetical protein NHG95_28425 [Pseudomonas corrugata]|uniref:hypothetical protein n=1 Tax=Pseudomonas corrugata TaxID=47879 RepID=UPI0028C4E63B|nr:hypothetical protein [Pseudomonas corrugata]MDU9037061.1 hypothetical protein [Pseudomonas corrugata]